MAKNTIKTKNLRSCLLVIGILLFWPIIALWWIWTKSHWTTKVRWIATSTIAALIVAVIIGIALTPATTQTAENQTATSASAGPTVTPTANISTSVSQKVTPAPAQTTTASQFANTAPSKSSNCHEHDGLPDSVCTPGATNPNVTQANIHQTICISGYTTTIRPPESYTENLKREQIKEYGYTDTRLSDYEEDHLIALEIGGSPDSSANLWPEPHTNPFGSYEKDKLENYLHKEVCSGAMSLADAQRAMASNWVTAYNANF